MKKIGVIDKTDFDGPGAKKVIYNYPGDSLMYNKNLVISVLDGQSNLLTTISPKYDSSKDIYFLGDIVEYDEETNSINHLYRELSDDELNQISQLYQKYLEQKGMPALSSLMQKLSECSSINEVKEILSSFNSSSQQREPYEIEIILRNLQREMSIRYRLQSSSTTGPKR